MPMSIGNVVCKKCGQEYDAAYHKAHLAVCPGAKKTTCRKCGDSEFSVYVEHFTEREVNEFNEPLLSDVQFLTLSLTCDTCGTVTKIPGKLRLC